MTKKRNYPCGRCVLTCGRRDSCDCQDGRYAVLRWGGVCSFYEFDELVENENLGKTETDLTYED